MSGKNSDMLESVACLQSEIQPGLCEEDTNCEDLQLFERLPQSVA